MAFTIVFPGNPGSYSGNPFKAETPFGLAQTVSVGDVCAFEDIMREALEAIVDGYSGSIGAADIAQAALDKVDALMMDELRPTKAQEAHP